MSKFLSIQSADERAQRFTTFDLQSIVSLSVSSGLSGTHYAHFDYSDGGTKLAYVTCKKLAKVKGLTLDISYSADYSEIKVSHARLEIVAFDAVEELLEMRVNDEKVIIDVKSESTIDADLLKAVEHNHTRRRLYDCLMSLRSAVEQKSLTKNSSGWGETGYSFKHEQDSEATEEAKALVAKIIDAAVKSDDDETISAVAMSLSASVAALYATSTHGLMQHNLLFNIYDNNIGGLGKTSLVKAFAHLFSEAEEEATGGATKASLLDLMHESTDQIVAMQELQVHFLKAFKIDSAVNEMHIAINGDGSLKKARNGSFVQRESRTHMLATANASIKNLTLGREVNAFLQRTIELELTKQLDARVIDAANRHLSVNRLGAAIGAVVELVDAQSFMSRVRKLYEVYTKEHDIKLARHAVNTSVCRTALEVAQAAFNVDTSKLIKKMEELIAVTFEQSLDESVDELLIKFHNFMSTSVVARDFKVDEILAQDAIAFERGGIVYLLESAINVINRNGINFDGLLRVLDKKGYLHKTQRMRAKVKVGDKYLLLYAYFEGNLEMYLNRDASQNGEGFGEIPF